MFKNYSKFFVGLIIFLSFFILRFHTFYLSHNNGDEVIFTSLASKIDKYGLRAFESNYNIFDTDIEIRDFWYTFRASTQKFGTLAKSISANEETGLEVATLSHHPPLLPFLLTASHKIFSPAKPYLANWQDVEISKIWPQFYACVVPFLASLLFVIAVYLLGEQLFSQTVGTLAAFLLVFTPIDILTSQKIWADDLVSLFSLISVLFYLGALRKNSLFLAVVSGIMVGIAFLAKQSGLFLVVIIPIAHLIFQYSRSYPLKKIILDKKIIVFFLFAFLSILPWTILFLKNNGFFKFLIQYDPIGLKATVFPTDFIRFVNSRPWYTYFLTLPFQQPLFFLSYLSPYYFFKDKPERKKLSVLIIWFLLFLFLLTLRRDKELRYMLPAYPAVTILTAYVFLRIRTLFNKDKNFLSLFLSALLILYVFISILLAVKIGLAFVFLRASLIPIPV